MEVEAPLWFKVGLPEREAMKKPTSQGRARRSFHKYVARRLAPKRQPVPVLARRVGKAWGA